MTPSVTWFTMPVDPAAFSGTPGVTGLAALPAANVLLAAAMDRRVVACDLATGKARHLGWAHDNWVHDVSAHPDGNRVATGGYDRRVKVWRWGHDRPLFDLAAHADWVRVVAFSPDGKLLASAGDDGTARLWDAATGRAVAALDAGDRLDALAWTPDGKRLLVSGNDGVVRFWDVGSPAARPIDVKNRRLIEDEPLNGGFSYPGGVRGLACRPDGKLAAAAGLDSLVVLDLASGKKTLEVPGRAFGAAFAPDGRLAFSQEKDLLFYDVEAKRVAHKIVVDQLGLFALCFLDGGKRLAAGACNGRVGVWGVPS